MKSDKQALLELMPEKNDSNRYDRGSSSRGYQTGFNQALQDTATKLAERVIGVEELKAVIQATYESNASISQALHSKYLFLEK